jgi:hypothetical protein
MSNLLCLNCNAPLQLMRRILTALVLTLVTLTAHAETATNAMTAAAADTASTAAGLASGLVEINPLGLAGSVVMKVAVISYIHKLPEEDRAHPYSLATSVWGGLAASNLCWLTGAGPLCFVLGIATGNYLWDNGEDDRRYWASCKSLRTEYPETPCSRSDKDTPAEPVLAQAP